MDAAAAPAGPTQVDFRAQLHEVNDQIQDPKVLRAAPTVEAEFGLSPAWQAQLAKGMWELDGGKATPAVEFFARLLAAVAV